MVKSAEAMSARARARQAKAQLDAQRAEQDRLVLDATTAFYEAVEALADARAAVVATEQRRAGSVAKLAGLGQTDDHIATLCGITAKEVRDARRLTPAAAARGSRPPPGRQDTDPQ